jgi:hypothetical protein
VSTILRPPAVPHSAVGNRHRGVPEFTRNRGVPELTCTRSPEAGGVHTWRHDATLHKTNQASLSSHQPPPDIAQLMAHTARSLAASPNPAMLVSKIMARHASDTRFAFLRPDGRWAGAWTRAKAAAGVKPPITASTSSARGGAGLSGLGGLGGYESSGSESGDTSDDDARNAPPPPPEMPPPPPPGPPPPSPPPP